MRQRLAGTHPAPYLVLAFAAAVLAPPAAWGSSTPLTPKDLFFTNTDHTVPTELTDFNGVLLYAGTDGVSGKELWRTDGTAGGTQLVKDICPGIGNSSPSYLTAFGSLLIFRADDGVHGAEPWVTDGTEAGTHMLKDVTPGPMGSEPTWGFTAYQGELYFGASDNNGGRALWKTDGTESGTVMVKAFGPALAVGSTNMPRGYVEVGGLLLFWATTPATGVNLWRTDGTEANTALVRQINPGFTSGISPDFLVALGDEVYFQAFNGTAWSLFKSDGTFDGTVEVKAIKASGSANIYYPTPFNGELYFFADDGSTGSELWKTDGTADGTVQVKDINSGANGSMVFSSFMEVVGSNLLFYADDGSAGPELWKTDGTSGGTELVKDIYSGSTGSLSTSFKKTCHFNGSLYFVAKTATHPLGAIFVTDGTADGTQEVIWKDEGKDWLAASNGKLFFAGMRQDLRTDVYVSDGTDANTQRIVDLNKYHLYRFVDKLTDVDGTLFFVGGDTFSGKELWKSDGTVAGTVQVKDIFSGSGSSSPSYLTSYKGKLFFTGSDSTAGLELLCSDGTQDGTIVVKDLTPGASGSDPAHLTIVNDRLFFSANTPTTGYELFASDGTEGGTDLVKNIRATTGSSLPQELTAFQDELFFTADDGTNGRELWKSDGTDTGTVLVKDINTAASTGSWPQRLTVCGDALFFTANGSSTEGIELWKGDGTDTGTVLVKDINAGAASSDPNELTPVDGVLFFTAYDPAHGVELWKSDGTSAGTVLVKDILAGAESSMIADLTAYKGKLYFRATDGTSGIELWESDGTGPGTKVAKDIVSGSGSSTPQALAVCDTFPLLFFSAYTDAAGFEPWRASGTSWGTLQADDVSPGAFSSIPDQFTTSGGKVFFRAQHETDGLRLWVFDAGTLLLNSLGDRVFEDPDNDGLFEPGGGETGIAGVTVALYDDNGSAAGTLDATDQKLGETVTDADGKYLFEDIPDGDYLVEVPATEFESGGALFGMASSTGNDPAPDPDDDADNDDNGSAQTGFGVTSKAISLATGTEPTTNGDSDANTNLALDLGFLTPIPPEITSAAFAIGGQGASFTHTLEATGSPAITFSVTGSLPDGLVFDGTSQVTGLPTTVGLTQVTITAQNDFGSDTQTLTIAVIASGDTDSDGFPDDFENAAGSDPGNAGDTPGGQTTTGLSVAMTAARVKIGLDFRKPLNDKLSIKGTLPVAAGFDPLGNSVQVFAGGIFEDFVLSDRGKAATTDRTHKLSLQIKRSHGVAIDNPIAKFKVDFKKSDLQSDLTDEGFDNAEIPKPGEARNLELIVWHDGTLYVLPLTLTYEAKLDRKGKAALPKAP